MTAEGPQGVSGVAAHLADPAELTRWLEEQAEKDRSILATEAFEHLLREAAQPRSASGNACVRLCGLVDQSSRSHSRSLGEWSMSQDVVLKLFDFYIEWNESDQHRSMKLVLDLIPQLLKKNEDRESATVIKEQVVGNLVSIISGRSTKPVARSAIKTLDHMMAKGVCTLVDIKASFLSTAPNAQGEAEIELWGYFFQDLFQWMRIHYVCPTAGRFIVSLYRALRRQTSIVTVEVWHKWLLQLLNEDVSLLESIKNYLFLPLFKADKSEALAFLQRMNEKDTGSQNSASDLDSPALLRLAALETGKRVGFVEEPGIKSDYHQDDASFIILQPEVLESVLAHPSHEVRSLAMSLLVTCPSTTRPFSSVAFDLLRRHLNAYFSDSGAKFRVDTTGKTRDMFKRVRGAIFVLKKSIPRAKAKVQKTKAAPGTVEDGTRAAAQPILYKANLISLPESQLIHCLGYHESFLRWYIDFLCTELTPTASYQRHVASLKALNHIFRMEADSSKTWETSNDQEAFYDLFDSKWTRTLLDLVMDPFDDVRNLAAASLNWLFSDSRYRKLALFSPQDKMSPRRELLELYRRASQLANRTSRADHSDGAARASQLLYRFCEDGPQRLELLSELVERLDQRVTAAEMDLGLAVLDNPLHGDLASLCFTWQVVATTELDVPEAEAVQALQDRIVTCCERVWEAVKIILCDDSPEGHLPQELEEVDGLDTKDLLSFSFRAVHEASNLLRIMALTVCNGSRKGFLTPSPTTFERIGTLTFRQLTALRHRGAFTTVSATFTVCCQQSLHVEDTSLLEEWYQGTLGEIQTQRSTTRRSAGIPSLMTSILSANASNPSFDEVMETLMAIAGTEARVSETDDSNLPQVHAYNCLKEIFRNSLLASLGNKSERYLSVCLELAANGLRSPVWAIRNCGLIFLRSLIDCLFGSNESKAMIEAGWDGKANRIHYHRYPNLPSVLVKLLNSGHQIMSVSSTGSSAAESVFPALDIIRRAGPPDLLRQELEGYITDYLSCPVWHVREMAARTLVSCLLHEGWTDSLRRITEGALSESSRDAQNRAHGMLLAVKFVFERRSVLYPTALLGDVPAIAALFQKHAVIDKFTHSPEVCAAYLELVNTIWLFQIAHGHSLATLAVTPASPSTSALLKIQRCRNVLIGQSVSRDIITASREWIEQGKLGVSEMVAVLELIPTLWLQTGKRASSSELCSFFVDVCSHASSSAEIQIVALQNLGDVLENVTLAVASLGDDFVDDLLRLWATVSSRPLNPALTDAFMRVSGGIMAALWQSGLLPHAAIRSWSVMLAEAGHDDKTFDSRIAAAEALYSFCRAAQGQSLAYTSFSLLLPLYDALNDDDDDIREVAAKGASCILGRALVPVEAADALIDQSAEYFSTDPLFKATVLDRIVGQDLHIPPGSTWTSAKDQIEAAMAVDDSLFAVEEQNLFVDEVRESKRWLSVLRKVSVGEKDAGVEALDAWVTEGLLHLLDLAGREDGPLGWASDPYVYAICSRVLMTAVTMKDIGRASADLVTALGDFRGKALDSQLHISGLLVDSVKHCEMI